MTGTDFKNFFPSNTKAQMVDVVDRAVQMVFKGKTKQGQRVPTNRWMTVPKGEKEKAVWGRRSIPGATYRRVSDVIEYLSFRAETANSFAVGDAILCGDEVIIGEKTSPAVCELKAQLDEDKLMDKMDDEAQQVFRATRYVDDGLRVVAIDKGKRREQSKQLAARVGDMISRAYSGIQVTEEGEATCKGETAKFLEYAVGVQECGDKLRWFHWSKNIGYVGETGRQKFKKLKHWRSGTTKTQLIGTLRTRLDDIAAMTRAEDGVAETSWRGSGCLQRDLQQSVGELVVEVYVTLGYRLREIVRLIKCMGRTSSMWAEAVSYVQSLKNKLEEEEREKSRGARFKIVYG